MKLRTKYLLFVLLLHLLTLVLSYFIFQDNKVLFICSEVIVLISLVISWQLYRQLLQPLQTLMRGVEAIKERDFTVKFVPTGKYEMDQLIAVYNNMIDELRGERTKQEEQHFFLEKLIHTSPTGIVILDFDDRVQQVNPKALSLMGLEEKEVLRKTVSEIDLPVMQRIATLKPGEATTFSINGINTYKLQKAEFIDRGFHRSFVMIEELTAEILAAEKKAYGKVIRMMAHEVNNTVGPVNSILDSALKTKMLWDDSRHGQVQEALQVAFNRNQNLNLFMRNFADVVRLPEPRMKPVNIKDLVKRTGILMQRRAGEKIRLVYELSRSPLVVNADEQLLEQALINIVKNSIEAIEGEGSVTFVTQDHPAILRIIDTGKGIAGEDAEQLFSPFFSTKPDGQGVGLTLTKEILLKHGFSFSLKSNTAGKTEFRIVF